MRKLLVLLLLLAPVKAGASAVAVYHTSDVHGWYFARPAAWDAANSTRPIGGFAAFSALLKKDTTPYILLDSGDMFQGTPEGILTRGMASVELMNQLGYSAAVPGNHDYDYGEQALQPMIKGAKFPFLGANLYFKSDGAHVTYLRPYIIVEKGGKKIAVLGLLGKHTATSTMPTNVNHLEFRDEAAEAAKWLPAIKEEHPDAVVVLAHLGISEAISLRVTDITGRVFEPAPPGTLQIARSAPGIDLLLGGHDHTALLRGYHDPESGTWFGESGYGLSYVTRALLDFDDNNGKLKSIDVKLVPLWIDQSGQDPEVMKTVAGYAAEVDRAMGQVIGTAAGDLSFSKEGLDSPIGNWGCDVTREAAGTELAFQNTKGIRAEIRKGPVKLRDLYQAVPFDNTLVTMRFTGAQIKQVMKDNIFNNFVLMQVSGLEVAYKPGPGGTAAEVHLYRDGREIKDDESFTVATNSYLAGGGDGGAVFSAQKDAVDTLIPVRDTLLEAFKKGPVVPPATGRIRRIK